RSLSTAPSTSGSSSAFRHSAQGLQYLFAVGKAARAVLGIDQRTVRRDVEHAVAALDELGLHAELCRDFGRQTGGPGEVVSTDAVLDGDAHDSRSCWKG